MSYLRFKGQEMLVNRCYSKLTTEEVVMNVYETMGFICLAVLMILASMFAGNFLAHVLIGSHSIFGFLAGCIFTLLLKDKK